MRKVLRWIWLKIGFIKLCMEEKSLQITVQYSFLFGLLIGMITGAVLW